MAIPIIFFHSGDSSYLKYSLSQAKYFNPDSTVYLLGDAANDKYPFVTHANINDFSQSVKAFAPVYQHLSTNSYDYEFTCFKRWFCLLDFCKANQIESFIYLDSDVLVFDNVTKVAALFGDCKIANAGVLGDCPSFIYFADFEAIQNLCNYLVSSYSDTKDITKINDWHKWYVSEHEWGGVCDMTLLLFYYQEHTHIFKIISLINDEFGIDLNINNSDGYETLNGSKKIYWRNKLPYCKRLTDGKYIRFIALHYQGRAKEIMYKHYKGKGYTLPILYEFSYYALRRAKRYLVSLKNRISRN